MAKGMTPEEAVRRLDDLWHEVMQTIHDLAPGTSTSIWEELFQSALGIVHDATVTPQVWRWTRDQAIRYMEAVYGPSWVYAAPETFPNILERWIIAIANNSEQFANKHMTQIEEGLAGLPALPLPKEPEQEEGQ